MSLMESTTRNNYLMMKSVGGGEDSGCTVVEEDSEISIFDARKYFNETNDLRENNIIISSSSNNKIVSPASNNYHLPPPAPRLSSVVDVDDGYSTTTSNYYNGNNNNRIRSFHATPTASSEASWNSQTGLLFNPPGSISVSLRNVSSSSDHNNNSKKKKKKKRGGGSSTSTNWFMRRKCPCSGKKSVDVKETTSNSECRNSTTSNVAAELRLPEKIMMIPNNNPQTISSSSDNNLKNQFPMNTTANHRLKQPQMQHDGSSCSLLGTFTTDASVGFSFPILNTTSSNMVLNKGIMPPPSTASLLVEDPPRESLEVFQPPEEKLSGFSSLDVQQRSRIIAPTAVAGEKDRCIFMLQGRNPVSSRVTATDYDDVEDDDDLASEASSDLFEIESLSTSTQPSSSYPMMIRRRESLDEASTFNPRRLGGGGGAAAVNNGASFYDRGNLLDESFNAFEKATASMECYEPSEASIDWSVTTASVANFSEMEDMTTVTSTRHYDEDDVGVGVGVGVGVEKRRVNSLLLSSCRHDKAVNVGPQPVKCEKTKSLNNNNNNKKPPLTSRSRSPRLSLAFAA